MEVSLIESCLPWSVTSLAVGVVGRSFQHEGTALSPRVFIATTFTTVRVERTTVELCWVSVSEVSDGALWLFITAWNTHTNKHKRSYCLRLFFHTIYDTHIHSHSCFWYLRERHHSKACWESKRFLLSQKESVGSFLLGLTETSFSNTSWNLCFRDADYPHPQHTHHAHTPRTCVQSHFLC